MIYIPVSNKLQSELNDTVTHIHELNQHRSDTPCLLQRWIKPHPIIARIHLISHIYHFSLLPP